ncbi:hypothetical protein ACFWAP_00910 [Streptomyces goshikiensis]|uniref:hypothetical protein n=1 Tax=Streptomyces goshikiensis TaxID=1942 RepID=UPI003653F069
MDDQTEWLRPEFRDRESDLVALKDLAKREGVSPQTLNNWMARHPQFPKVVKIVRGQTTTKYISLSEFDDKYKKARARLAKKKPTARAERRPAVAVLREKVEAAEARQAKLREEEKVAAAVLQEVLVRSHQADKELGELKAKLKAEVEAARQVEIDS